MAGIRAGWFIKSPSRCGLNAVFLAPVTAGRDGQLANVNEPSVVSQNPSGTALGYARGAGGMPCPPERSLSDEEVPMLAALQRSQPHMKKLGPLGLDCVVANETPAYRTAAE